MRKIQYTATALQPIFTGSDEDAGTLKTLRREKVKLPKAIRHKSWFKSENSRRVAILMILERIWKSIDFEPMRAMRKLKIWDEFSSKLLAATRIKTRFQFINELCRFFNIKALNDDKISDILQRFSDDEFLNIIREEQQFLVLLLRNKRAKEKDTYKRKKQENEDSMLEDLPEERKEDDSKNYFGLKNYGKETDNDSDKLYFSKTFDRVPYISGNSIRGILRRLVMYDFCQLVGIEKLEKNMYHQLFTGGNITDSTIYEDIAQREKYIAMCPMIGLFGSAIGNMTITGELKVGAMRPICKEHRTGDISFWELLNTEFGVRRDDSKLERDIKIITESAKKEKPQQMKYEYEVFIKGTEFNHQFICVTHDELIESAFYHTLSLFKQTPFVGGASAIGNGHISLDYVVDSQQTALYLKYLQDSKAEIQDYFKVK